MRKTVATAMALAVLALAGGASAADIGANDDTGKFAADGGAVFFSEMGMLGLKQSVMTTRFDCGETESQQTSPTLLWIETFVVIAS